MFEEKRVSYRVINDDEALKAFQLCSKLEGIIPALEPAHALGELIKIAPNRKKDEIVVMNSVQDVHFLEDAYERPDSA